MCFNQHAFSFCAVSFDQIEVSKLVVYHCRVRMVSTVYFEEDVKSFIVQLFSFVVVPLVWSKRNKHNEPQQGVHIKPYLAAQQPS